MNLFYYPENNKMHSRCILTRTRLPVVLLALFIAGCAPSYQVTRPDPETGLLSTNVEVKSDDIKIYEPSSSVHELRFVVLRSRTRGRHTDGFDAFFKASLEQLGFEHVIDHNELVRMVLRSSLRDTVGNVTDPIALAKINEAIGPFVIIDAQQAFLGDAWFETYLRLTDPANAQTYLEVHRIRVNWGNLYKEVNYPVLNVLKRWIDDSQALPASPRDLDENVNEI